MNPKMTCGLLVALAMIASPAFAGSAFLGRDWSRTYYAKDQDNGGGTRGDTLPATTPAEGTTNATVPNCLQCDPPSIHVWAAMEGVINGASANQLKPVGGIYLEAPVTIGSVRPTTIGRVFARLTVQPQPGASTATPDAPSTILNFQGFEGLVGVERVLGRSQGITTSAIAAVWLGTRFSSDPAPLDSMKHGWGVGMKIRGGGSFASGVCGTDSSIGDDGAVQCRTYGRIMMPKTASIGSVYFDALLSFFQPQALDLAGRPIPSTTRHVVVLLGVGVNADAIFAAFSNKGAGT